MAVSYSANHLFAAPLARGSVPTIGVLRLALHAVIFSADLHLGLADGLFGGALSGDVLSGEVPAGLEFPPVAQDRARQFVGWTAEDHLDCARRLQAQAQRLFDVGQRRFSGRCAWTVEQAGRELHPLVEGTQLFPPLPGDPAPDLLDFDLQDAARAGVMLLRQLAPRPQSGWPVSVPEGQAGFEQQLAELLGQEDRTAALLDLHAPLLRALVRAFPGARPS